MEDHRGFLERRQHERHLATMQIKYYIIEKTYAEQLAAEAAYKDTTIAKLAEMPMPKTMLSGVTENISAGGLALVSNEPLSIGTYVVVDITMPNMPRPLRALAEVVRSDQDQGKVVDRTIQTYKCGLKILAINRDDMRRIESYIIEGNMRSSNPGKTSK
jgi:c-di-GMP-binding flagellar brake protein YcgR